MQLTIDIKNSAYDKVINILDSLKDDVKIVEKLDIEPMFENDKDYKYIKETINPKDYEDENSINWN